MGFPGKAGHTHTRRRCAGAGAGLAALALLFGLVAVPGRGERAPGDRAGGPRTVEADRLLAQPGEFVGGTVLLSCTFAGWRSDWNPFLTRFGPGEFFAFEAWSEEQFPWVPVERQAPALFLFVRRGGAAAWALEDTRRYTHLELTLKVRSAFAGRLWAEVVGVRPLPDSLDAGGVLHAARAIEAMREARWRRARQELQRALAGPAPAAARSELERLLAICGRRIAPFGIDPDRLHRVGGDEGTSPR